ncbi:hypothetical protein BCR44DRAFT_1424468 [Catenaria anguillulae PL171]|uniref:THUMP domain-containing protein n=1 Tax=Catenaria anguillulae PL171 TaxID=765915 RepID=A0A1Y2I2D2_9FUNG|nr:hypothetical protein BCR44DRAFT_1424468 [Catenaria anguillulae PL171]
MDAQNKPKQPSEKKRKHYPGGDKPEGKLTKRQKRDGGATRIEAGMERQASKEVSAILMERIEAMYPDLLATLAANAATEESSSTNNSTEPAAAKPTSIEDEIAAELQELSKSTKGNHATSHLVHIGTAVDCLARAMDPVAVVQSAIDEALAKRESGTGGLGGAKTRFANRIIPFQRVVKADKDEILSEVAQLVSEAGLEGNQTVCPRRRGHLDRNTLIADLASPMIAAGHSVDLSHPQVSIIVEVYRHIAGLCVVKDGQYTRLRKFNLHEVYAKGEDKAPAATVAENGSAEEAKNE